MYTFTNKLGLSSLILLHLISSLTSNAQLILPSPNGTYAVGHSVAKMVDESRVDPYDPKEGKRALMMSLFYPVERKACEETCQIDWMSPVTASYGGQLAVAYNISDAIFQNIKFPVCCKYSDEAAETVPSFPLVLFSPGLGGSRQMYNAMASSLASSGYAVATIDVPYDSFVVEFPDGSLIPGKNLSYWDGSFSVMKKLLDTRVDDGRFVLSQLGNTSVVQELVPGASCGFFTKRAGFFGHSYGGATALAALMKDRRFVGGIDMDGSLWGNITDIHQAGVIFNTPMHNFTQDPSLQEGWDHMKGWRRELTLNDTVHLTFSDIPLLVKSLGVPINDTVRGIIGGLDPDRSFSIITTFVRAVMDYALQGKDNAILDGNTAAYPEVEVNS
ncbi:hypothetical protein EJ04DRAFT_480974 [Polyplosphaeria fusca]|uniref:1-alkyl-2-acetylglycerophosphocholine esterase n=1 Tax=Polyplosphaeria fusca TaxID=682080 RepID=A0A9P4R970_9PLEO|nr:hypothetical protein EJ04DRAFT_480974 [Polyplosphaeria fusca]